MARAKLSWSAGLALMIVSGAATAALPPGAYKRMRAAAQVEAVIQVIRLTLTERISGDTRESNVRLLVEVVSVTRGAVKPKHRFFVTYRSTKGLTRGIPGPRRVPILRAGMIVRAWLNRVGPDEFRPAAHGASFARVPKPR